MECIFCKIVSGEIPSAKFYEDENCIGVLDLFPNTPGQALVISKRHVTSDFSSAPEEEVQSAIRAARKIAEAMKRAFQVKRAGIIIEGIHVDHLHVKVYPFHGELKVDHSLLPKVWFEKYPGYMTSLTGRMASQESLAKLAEVLKSALSGEGQ